MIRYYRKMITLYMGPMFSGKTTRLTSDIRRHMISGKRCLLVRYLKDNRPSDNHDNINYSLDCDILRCDRGSLSDILPLCDKYDVIGIDEAQFYDELESVCLRLKDQGIWVIVSGLVATYQLEMFRPIIQLLPHADKIKKMNAICISCGDEAIYSIRTCNSPELVKVGGLESYSPMCRDCHK